MQPEPRPEWTLAEADGWWIEARCACGRRSHLPCRMLGRVWSTRRTVAEVVARLVCRDCNARPAEATLIDSPQLGAPGYVSNAEQRRLPL